MPSTSWTETLARAARLARALLAPGRTTDRPSGSGGRPTSGRPTGGAGRPTSGAPRPGPRDRRSPAPRTTGPRPTEPDRSQPHAATTSGAYPGDYTGRVTAVYAPELDGDADPGEIVWTWVPYEEDHSRGKDRPVVVVGHDGPWLLGLMLTSKDNTRSARPGGPRWMDIGSGPWDSKGRDSEVRLDRVVRVDPDAVRREGAIVDRATFERIVAAM